MPLVEPVTRAALPFKLMARSFSCLEVSGPAALRPQGDAAAEVSSSSRGVWAVRYEPWQNPDRTAQLRRTRRRRFASWISPAPRTPHAPAAVAPGTLRLPGAGAAGWRRAGRLSGRRLPVAARGGAGARLGHRRLHRRASTRRSSPAMRRNAGCERLREFWETITARPIWFFTPDGDDPAQGPQCAGHP